MVDNFYFRGEQLLFSGICFPILWREDFKDRILSEFPTTNILINNAGVGKRLILQKNFDGFDSDEEIRVNLSAPIQLTHLFLNHFLKQESAAFINITSALASLPLPILPVYSATKAGLHSYTLSLRQQLKNSNIKVFELAPPTTETEMLNGFKQSDLKGVSVMKPQELVKLSIDGILNDKWEIYPGASGSLKLLSRIWPDFALSRMSHQFQQANLKENS
ncbi:MAG: SDR family NAD(P)-dependent oxidoreductase [Bdellovibrionaceae bacterium]|nr:SDR family NAD(P)-dependent oxidoreductase [Pseudobdellovibrionaceae bacterium]